MINKQRTYGIVIPVGNNSRFLGDVLSHINALNRKADEVVIVNDRITDNTLDCLTVLDQPYKLVETLPDQNRYGVSAARNIGVENCSCDIIVFVDSDVLLTPDYISSLDKTYQNEDQDIDGIMGLSSEFCPFGNFSSQYKNLWMRFTYIRMEKEAGSITTSSLAIKRDVFIRSGGFDEFRRRDVEDAVYGFKLQKQGYTTIVDKSLDYIHKKYYNMASLFKIDIFRSRKLTEFTFPLIFNKEKKPESSIPSGYFLSIPLVYLGMLSLIFSFISPLFLIISPIIFFSANLFSLEFIIYTFKIKGLRFAIRSFFKQYFVFIASGLGILAGIVNLIFVSPGKRRKSSLFKAIPE